MMTARRFLKLERGIRSYRPTIRIADRIPPKPNRADEVLAALARSFEPGREIGLSDIMDAAGVRRHLAFEVRRWAKASGSWPFADASGGFAALRRPGKGVGA